MHEPREHHGHIVSTKLYFLIFASLLVLTWLTVAIAKADLEPFNTLLALAVAVTKASLVVLFFMHLRWSSTLVRLFLAAGLSWLALMIGLTAMDFFSRAWQMNW